LNFSKLHSAGNDFVIIEASNNEVEWSKIAQNVCQRHFGIGADGLILLLPSKNADIGMRIFNSDGSESEACGNGLMCLVKYAINRSFVPKQAKDIYIETIAGIRKAKISTKIIGEYDIQVSMGEPEFDAAKIPAAIDIEKQVDIKLISGYSVNINNQELLINLLAIGNPHAVHFQQQQVNIFPLSRIGPIMESHKLFPNRTNFEVAKVINRRLIEVRVWERGVGETLACGTGACAVTVAAQLLGYADNPVSIRLPGGILKVDWDRENEIMISGPVKIVFSGEWPD
jgi:diaminopimelate epimerase